MIVPVLRELDARGRVSRCSRRTIRRSRAIRRRVHDDDLAVSWHHDVETVPTVIRVVDGVEVDRTVGWYRPDWERVTGVADLGAGLPGDAPRMRFAERRPRPRRRAACPVRRERARARVASTSPTPRTRWR